MPRDPAPVSVIIPAYNAEATIGRALASIARQTLKPAEVIVVDDGSADATVDAAMSMQGSMAGTKLIVVSQENKGAGAARNRAIAEARETYLAFLDADDEWLPEKLERSLQVLQDGDYLLVAHDYLDTTPGGDQHIDCRRRFEEGTDPYTSLYLKGYIPSISVVTRRDAVLAAGGFDETLRNAQDFDLWLKLLADPDARFTLFGEALARYYHIDGSIMSHTDRRITCCTEIARRYLPALKARRAAGLLNQCRRLAYIYMEAAQAQPAGRTGYVLRFFVEVLRSIFAPLKPVAPVLSGLWIIAILGAYLFQFRELFNPILDVLSKAAF
ncbi:glycosyltransferase family A protein [Thalassospiraceae bacterium LMO-JJ14]|nr:glycosyltransferase family A protein [Thalassospiraceae bacterium LMO-JJ14]